MNEVMLKVENVSKQYQLGTFGTRTIGGDFQRWWTMNVLGKEDPFLKVGSINDRTSKEKAKFVWALKDINFEVNKGEVLGIIGKNGAGKSTLLKLLSRVTTPTTGKIRSAGRIASLLEVGTGFHPELTGIENIYLNGAILGMSKREIKLKLEEIIDFSGCSLYIDTPVKRYSSGMKVRLGFAVAAFLDPEILIVDEVLAVGDAEFQRRAIGKLKDVSSNEGRTVLFVSHNMDAVEQLCSSVLIVNNGKIMDQREFKNPKEIINEYLEIGLDKKLGAEVYPLIKHDGTSIQHVYFNDKNNLIDFHQDIVLFIDINYVSKVVLTVELLNVNGARIMVKDSIVERGGVYQFMIKKNILLAGEYQLKCYLSIPKISYVQIVDPIFFKVKTLPEEFVLYSDNNTVNYPFGYFYNSDKIELL
jgi:lipopolysaccharide transport system ATP-binding protein